MSTTSIHTRTDLEPRATAEHAAYTMPKLDRTFRSATRRHAEVAALRLDRRKKLIHPVRDMLDGGCLRAFGIPRPKGGY